MTEAGAAVLAVPPRVGVIGGGRMGAGGASARDRLVGLDVRLNIAEYLHRTLGERFAPAQLLRDEVAAREPGRTSGSGFHSCP